MNSHSSRTVISVFRLQKSISHPYALMRTARIGVVNRYKYVSVTGRTDPCFLSYRTTHARTSTLSAK